jgi:hypothetical protein
LPRHITIGGLSVCIDRSVTWADVAGWSGPAKGQQTYTYSQQRPYLWFWNGYGRDRGQRIEAKKKLARITS